MNMAWGTVIAAVANWLPVISFAIFGPAWMALVWLIPALMWTWLAYMRLRDEYGVR